MKILKVIHGYPMRYNAGSEVYSQMLCQELAKHHEVHVFTREENPFSPDYAIRLEQDPDDPKIQLHLINIVTERRRFQYRHALADKSFAKILDEIKPDIVHIGHLNHLSTSIVREAHIRAIPQVFTLHDYWLMCPRGQFIQRSPAENEKIWNICDGQQNRKCAINCYSGCISGAENELEMDIRYWEGWIERRMAHIHQMVEYIDYFIAPAKYLYHRFVKDFQLPKIKLCYLDYGFDTKRLIGRSRIPSEPFTFGYIGTHIPSKGIQQLIEAFSRVTGNCLLRIWGRANENTKYLQSLANETVSFANIRVEWMGEYHNSKIVPEVFNKVDCIVVPSIWVENSPLVIHEALQLRIPVITADSGGMAEYVHHEINGLLFKHRDVESLTEQLQRFADNPKFAKNLGKRGYLNSEKGDIPDMETHVKVIETIYQDVVTRRNNNDCNKTRTMAYHI